jgi:hypothetical protein
MIVMIESGRLGNQVFQYLALRHCARAGERIWLLGFDQLNIVFDGVEARFRSIQENPLRHLHSLDSRTLAQLARFAPSTAVITEDEMGMPVTPGGSRLKLVEPSWFQNSSLLDEPALKQLKVRDTWLAHAREALDDAGLLPEQTAFVHARAGDYRTWPSPESPAILDPNWYMSQARELTSANPELRFAVIGDDSDYRSEVAAAIPGAVEVKAGFETEFALMTLCPAGLLSASTFAFWGAFFAHRALTSGHFIAPRYWAGHRTAEWYPTAIQAPFLTYA